MTLLSRVQHVRVLSEFLVGIVWMGWRKWILHLVSHDSGEYAEVNTRGRVCSPCGGASR